MDAAHSEIIVISPSVVHMRVKVLENLRVSLLLVSSHARNQLFVDVRHGKLLAPDLNRRDVSVVVIVIGG